MEKVYLMQLFEGKKLLLSIENGGGKITLGFMSEVIVD